MMQIEQRSNDHSNRPGQTNSQDEQPPQVGRPLK